MFLFYKAAPTLESNSYGSSSAYRHLDAQRLLPLLTALIIATGAFLRLYHFLDNRSLWRDELYLAVSLIKMGFWELATQPLAYEQKAPLGYLWTVKLMVLLFGKGEMALRLPSLLTGVAALAFFAPVARHFLRPWAALLALAILALATPVVYHAVEVKQYGTELFASVLALYLYLRFHRQTGTAALLRWGAAGAALLWFSYSAIFVLAGIAFAVCLSRLLEKDWRALFRYTACFSLWLASFAAVYLLFLGRYKDSDWLIDFFEKATKAFLPFPPSSAQDLHWFWEKAVSLLNYPLGLTFQNLSLTETYFFKLFKLFPLLLLVAGVVLMLRKRTLQFAILALPILLTLVASALKLYPFYDRLTLFLAPMLILFIGYGAQMISSVFSRNFQVKLLLTILLLVPPTWNAARKVNNTMYFYKKEMQREALLFINERYKDGDVVYIYWNMWQAYIYYKDAYNLKFTAIRGKNYYTPVSENQADYLRLLSSDFKDIQSHNRLWYLYNIYFKHPIGGYIGHPAWYYDPALTPGKMLETEFLRFGTRMEEKFESKGSVVSLFTITSNLER